MQRKDGGTYGNILESDRPADNRLGIVELVLTLHTVRLCDKRCVPLADGIGGGGAQFSHAGGGHVFGHAQGIPKVAHAAAVHPQNGVLAAKLCDILQQADNDALVTVNRLLAAGLVLDRNEGAVGDSSRPCTFRGQERPTCYASEAGRRCCP